MSDLLRITGLASGLDVDTLVQKMMKAENMRLDKFKQDRQIVEWKQTLYRDTIGDLNIFRSNYFDVLKPDNYMLSKGTFSAFEVKNNTSPNTLGITASAGAVSGNYTVSDVTIATKATTSGSEITLKQAPNTVNFQIATESHSLKFKIDDKFYTVDVSSGTYSNVSQYTAAINSSLLKAKDEANADQNISSMVQATVSEDGTEIQFSKVGTSNLQEAIFTSGTSNSTYSIDNSSSINAMNFNIMIYDGTGSAPANNVLTFSMKDPNDPTKTITKSVTIPPAASGSGYTSLVDFTTSLNQAITDQINSDLTSPFKGKLNFIATTDGRIKLEEDGTDIINVSGNATRSLGFGSDNFSINPTAYDKMSSLISTNLLPGFTGVVTFSLNGQNISYDFNSSENKNKSLTQVMDEISIKANAKITYSELGRKFTLSTSTTGSDQSLNLSWSNTDASTKEFVEKLFGIKTSGTGEVAVPQGSSYVYSKSGTDAMVTIQDPNGNTSNVIKHNNNFSIDGVTYSLQADNAGSTTFTLSSNTQTVFDKVKGFVDKYNETIEKINTMLSERKQYNYKPLTDDQKKDMSDDEIKLWEEKAKQGLLSSDSSLNNMLTSLRRAFYDAVKVNASDPDGTNIGISLSDIGLSTSSDTTKRGKIVINESKLKAAIENNGDKVANLFMKVSTAAPTYSSTINTSNTDLRKSRYAEEGIFQRVNDILQDYVRTSRDSNSKKGILTEVAGIKGDYSELHNTITTELDDKDKVIQNLITQLAAKENKYYLQFSKLDQAMQKMNEQSSWLTSQLSAMGG